MLTQHCDTGVVVVLCFLGQINVAKWSEPQARTNHDWARYTSVDLWIN